LMVDAIAVVFSTKEQPSHDRHRQGATPVSRVEDAVVLAYTQCRQRYVQAVREKVAFQPYYPK
ncbi:MAG: hypothetical protein PHH80_03125, partial [Sphaerochaetaceae bacterium]|nr:hypothetical protein [Sphaerochaetaceae bacterium]